MTYEKFHKRWEEVLDIPPQRLGFLTPLYKASVRHLKVMPWPWFLIISMFLVLGTYGIAGSAITLLVSILQRGF